MNSCSVDECGGRSMAKGLCRKHYDLSRAVGLSGPAEADRDELRVSILRDLSGKPYPLRALPAVALKYGITVTDAKALIAEEALP